MPLVSVIMPVFNGELYLAEAIDSILSQTFTDFELIIVDDGSEDGSAEIIRAYEKRDGRIQFIQLDENVGTADARNSGLWRSNGKYVTMMDCDDVSLPERLELQVDFLESNAEIDAVGASGRAMTEDMTKLLFELKAPTEHWRIVSAYFVGVSFIFATIMVRATVIRESGGYRQGKRTVEDRELYWRILWETRAKFSNLPDFLYLYRQHSQSISYNRVGLLKAETTETQKLMLRQLLPEASLTTMNRFHRMATGQRLGWLDRTAARRDMTRMVESAIAHGLVEPGDKRLMVNDMRLRLEGTMPRTWQKLLHLGRYRQRRLFSLIAGNSLTY